MKFFTDKWLEVFSDVIVCMFILMLIFSKDSLFYDIANYIAIGATAAFIVRAIQIGISRKTRSYSKPYGRILELVGIGLFIVWIFILSFNSAITVTGSAAYITAGAIVLIAIALVAAFTRRPVETNDKKR